MSPSHASFRTLFAALAGAALAMGGLAAIPAAHAATTAVTLVGSFQSELGCADDWQPQCAATEMRAAGGSDVYELTATVPAGDWEFKVALNRGWDEAYGEDGQNVPLTVAGPTTLTFSYDDGTHALGVTPTDLPGAAAAADDPVVTVPGSHNAAMGCAGDWQPDCDQARLVRDEQSGWYTATFNIPAGSYEYKVAIGGSWDENYGAGGVAGGDNLTYTSAGGTVTFYYDPVSHYATTSADGPVVTLPGSFNEALGCAGDWAPDCLSTLMRTDGDGRYTFTTDRIPTGSHEVKVAHGLSWDENYGVGGASGGANYSFAAREGKVVTFTYTLNSHELQIEVTDPPLQGTGEARAHWLDRATIAVPPALFGTLDPADANVVLGIAADGAITLDEGTLVASGGDPVRAVQLEYAGALSGEQTDRFPHLKDAIAFRAPMDRPEVEEALRGALALYVAGDEPVALTGLQVPGVLDDLYAADARGAALGVTWRDAGTASASPTVRLWAPTAKNAGLLLWPDGTGAGEPQVVAMDRGADGTWSVTGDAGWKDRAYRYSVEVYVPGEGAVVTNEVTDPYSVGLAAGSTHSVLLDLDDPALIPEAFRATTVPVVARAVDQMIYELHVRDFSINDETVPAELRGTYGAFTVADSTGIIHLRRLADAGVNSLHLLPTFDIASIPEPRSAQMDPDVPDAGPASPDQQAAVAAVADKDGFNWGYDPYHFFAPEGSYARDDSASGRVREYREMVAAVNGTGMRVIADQVFNHTAQSGQSEKSVLDKVVPGYYHRLNAAGKVETSTCCENVASEHEMAEQLMVDAVVTWARDYHVSGFRFDLMGHHSVANMRAIQKALGALTVERDGVDGSTIHLYGEGWNFGEVADNARFTQATQGQLAGTGIGTFSDRLRDAVHGGSPVDGDSYRDQGFGTGLFTDPNGVGRLGGDDDALAKLRSDTDLVRLGLAGNLADFSFLTADGTTKAGRELDYRGAPAGYAAEPDEVISYVDAHDNETLYDLSVLKLPEDTSMADRVRMNTVQLSTVTLAQTPAFWHAGTDLLRSKSLDRDSYNSGDHFNAIDFGAATQNFGVGLPPKEKNGERWDIMAPLLADPEKRAEPADIALARDMALELVELRYDTELVRLGSAAAISEKVTFPGAGPEQTPGLLVMSIDDTKGAPADDALDEVLVVINASDEDITEALDGYAGRDFALNAIQAQGVDDVVRRTAWSAADGSVTIPARTTAVLYREQAGAEPTASPTASPTVSPSAPTTAPTGSPTASPTAGGGRPPIGLPITGAGGGGLLLLAVAAIAAGAGLYRRRRA